MILNEYIDNFEFWLSDIDFNIVALMFCDVVQDGCIE